MKKTIFYSWQSDLPNNSNRGFINQCLEMAVKELSEDIAVEAVIDRDTKSVIGTPDIVSTIFNKIDNCNIFVADVSFINPDFSGKKCPNPNVLIELGYAAKSLGWDKIICIFNSDYGKVEDLPFDLRFRRPISYHITDADNKNKDRKALVKVLKDAMSGIIEHDSNQNELQDYLKKILDKEVLTISNHLLKIIYGYEYGLNPHNISILIETSIKDLEYNIFERKILGFTLFKDWQSYVQKLEALINQPFFIQNASSLTTSHILKIIKSLRAISALHVHNDMFIMLEEDNNYNVISAQKMNPDNPKDEYILLHRINQEHGTVIDWGKVKKTNVRRLITYHRIKSSSFQEYIGYIFNLIQMVRLYVDSSQNEFILDPLEFRIGAKQ